MNISIGFKEVLNESKGFRLRLLSILGIIVVLMFLVQPAVVNSPTSMEGLLKPKRGPRQTSSPPPPPLPPVSSSSLSSTSVTQKQLAKSNEKVSDRKISSLNKDDYDNDGDSDGYDDGDGYNNDEVQSADSLLGARRYPFDPVPLSPFEVDLHTLMKKELDKVAKDSKRREEDASLPLAHILRLLFNMDESPSDREKTLLSDLNECGVTTITKTDFDNIAKQANITTADREAWEKGQIYVEDFGKLQKEMSLLRDLLVSTLSDEERQCLNWRRAEAHLYSVARVLYLGGNRLVAASKIRESEINAAMTAVPDLAVSWSRAFAILQMELGSGRLKKGELTEASLAQAWEDHKQQLVNVLKRCEVPMSTREIKGVLEELEKTAGMNNEMKMRWKEGGFEAEDAKAISVFRNEVKGWLMKHTSGMERRCMGEEVQFDLRARMHRVVEEFGDGLMRVFRTALEDTPVDEGDRKRLNKILKRKWRAGETPESLKKNASREKKNEKKNDSDCTQLFVSDQVRGVGGNSLLERLQKTISTRELREKCMKEEKERETGVSGSVRRDRRGNGREKDGKKGKPGRPPNSIHRAPPVPPEERHWFNQVFPNNVR